MGQYWYMQDLLALEATATGLGPQCFKPATPLSVPAWQQALESHPDKYFVECILSGIGRGFHIGADRARLVLKRSPSNLPSVRQHATIVEEHVVGERAAGRLLGPLPPQLARLCHTSPISLIPKPHQPGRWRSHPRMMVVSTMLFQSITAICTMHRCFRRQQWSDS